MDDFDREVYCIAGLPFDAVNMRQAIEHLWLAKLNNQSCFLTTPNLNFLALSQSDAHFRDSVIHSDFVIADGTPIVWLAKLLGIPIKERVAGSSLFEVLSKESTRKMTVYFFGGPEGAAAEAAKKINETSAGLACVGYCSAGFGSLEEMSSQSIIDTINNSKADFLVVALGAKKGQDWIVKNKNRITCPIVSHLGAVVNFEAKRLKRAPEVIQKLGLEWAWRIKEEPSLWKRYWGDGLFFLKLLITKILPQVLWLLFNKSRLIKAARNSSVFLNVNGAECRLVIRGVVLDPLSKDIRELFKQASIENKNVCVDLSAAVYLSFGVFALLLIMKKHLKKSNLDITFTGLSAEMQKIFNQNCLDYLIR